MPSIINDPQPEGNDDAQDRLPRELPPHPSRTMTRERYAEYCAIVGEMAAGRGMPVPLDLPSWDGPR